MTISRDEILTGRYEVPFKGFTTFFPSSDNDAVYINSLEDLAKIGTELPANGYYILTRDLDASGWTGWANTLRLVNGHFNGDGHIISNLALTVPEEEGGLLHLTPGGLFREISYSTFENLTLADIDIRGEYPSGLTSEAESSRIYNCHTSGLLTGETCSGLMLFMNNSILLKCTSTCTIDGQKGSGLAYFSTARNKMLDCHYNGNMKCQAGAGLITSATKPLIVEKCSTSGTITYGWPDGFEEADYTGTRGAAGLLGIDDEDLENDTDLTDCFTTMAIDSTGFDYKGSLVIAAYSANVTNCYSASSSANPLITIAFSPDDLTVTDCYWDSDLADTTSTYGTGKTTAEMKTCATYVGWDLLKVWSCANGRYPAHTKGLLTIGEDFLTPIYINSVADLLKIGVDATNPNYGTYVLATDLDLTGETVTPLDLEKGVFLGEGYTISNLTIDSSTSDKVGLFKEAKFLSNVTLDTVAITGYDSVGALAGICTDVQDCTCTNIDITGHDNVGGMVGGSTNTFHAGAYRCDTSGVVTGSGVNTGGITGLGTANMYDCFSDTTVSSTGANTGGISGKVWTLERCAHIGPVVGTTAVGGLNGGGNWVRDCYQLGDVSGSDRVAGLVGAVLRSNYEAINSYVVGAVTSSGAELADGLMTPYIGSRPFFSGIISDSFYAGEAELNQGGTKVLATELECPSDLLGTWNFSSTWNCDTGEYPNLQTVAGKSSDLYILKSSYHLQEFSLPRGGTGNWGLENIIVEFASTPVDTEMFVWLKTRTGLINKIHTFEPLNTMNFANIPMRLEPGDRVFITISGLDEAEYSGPEYQGYITYVQ